jgi:uncharacterized membrane protein
MNHRKLFSRLAKLPTNIEKVFLVLALVFGGIFIFSIEPLHGNDEIVHFPRAYHIQEGNMNVEHLGGYDYGGQVPVQIKQFNDGFREQVQNDNPDPAQLRQLKQQYSRERLTDERREPLAFTSTGVYSAWSYLPSAAGVKLAQVLNLPLVWYVYMARIMCLLAWAALTYLAIRLLPFGKPLLLAVALLPTSLVQATTMGMDGIVTSLGWLIIALTIAALVQKDKGARLAPLTLLLLAFLGLYLATTKQGYVLLAAFPLIIPARLYPFKQKTANFIRISFGAVLVLISIWYFRQTAPIADVMHFVQRPGLFVDSAAQWRHVLENPLSVLTMIVAQPFTLGYGGIYAGMVGVLTNRMIHLPVLTMVLLYLGLLTAAISTEKAKKLKLDWKRLLLGSAAVLAGTYVLISLALYVSFTRVGHPYVEGIQGRYFLPLLPLLAIWGAWLPKKHNMNFDTYVLPGIVLISLAGLLSATAALL